MLVSIALCTYNGEAFLEEQLRSILNQSYPNLEVVVCDDASSDNTREILLGFSADKRMKLLINEKNLGATKAFEKALQHCHGDWIAFADQDDVWKKDKIEKMIRQVGSQLLLYHNSELVNEEGKPIGKTISDLRNLYSGSDTRGFVFSNCVWGHAILFNRSMLKHLLPMPATIPHDIWTAFVATSLNGIHYLEEPLVQYRQHSRTVTTTLPPDKMEQRNLSQKAQEYHQQLYWIGVMRDFKGNQQKAFYRQLYILYQQKEKGFSWKLFWFLLQHRNVLFRFSKKSAFSKINEIRKQARRVEANACHPAQPSRSKLRY